MYVVNGTLVVGLFIMSVLGMMVNGFVVTYSSKTRILAGIFGWMNALKCLSQMLAIAVIAIYCCPMWLYGLHQPILSAIIILWLSCSAQVSLIAEYFCAGLFLSAPVQLSGLAEWMRYPKRFFRIAVFFMLVVVVTHLYLVSDLIYRARGDDAAFNVIQVPYDNDTLTVHFRPAELPNYYKSLGVIFLLIDLATMFKMCIRRKDEKVTYNETRQQIRFNRLFDLAKAQHMLCIFPFVLNVLEVAGDPIVDTLVLVIIYFLDAFLTIIHNVPELFTACFGSLDKEVLPKPEIIIKVQEKDGGERTIIGADYKHGPGGIPDVTIALLRRPEVAPLVEVGSKLDQALDGKLDS